MTLDKEAWLCFENQYSNVVHGSLPKGKKYTLYCKDGMHRIRSMGAHQSARYQGDQSHTENCAHMKYKLTTVSLNKLTNEPFQISVLSWDPYGHGRAEKKATHIARRKQSKIPDNVQLQIPPGQSRYFEDNKPMPDIDMVFHTPAARRDLYVYMTEYMQSPLFASKIPSGKVFIFSGGLVYTNLKTRETKNVDPIIITCQSWKYFPTKIISEGDSDVWRWLYIFSEHDALVDSDDREVLLIGLMQMRLFSVNYPQRSVFFKTKYGDGVNPIHPGLLLWHQANYKRFQTLVVQDVSKEEAKRLCFGVSTPKPRDPIKWKDRFVDIYAAYQSIMQEATIYNNKLQCQLIDNPVEQLVMFMIIASSKHDFFQRSLIRNQMGPKALWNAFMGQGSRQFVWKIVQVLRHPVTGHHCYTICFKRLKEWIKWGHYEAAKLRLKYNDKKETLQDYEKRVHANALNRITKYVADDMNFHVAAAQLRWVFNYYTNAAHPLMEVANGLETHGDLSRHGYTPHGYATVVEQNQHFIAI